jgi:hypothetical protein
MTFLLAILAFFAASVYFYYPLEERLLQPVQLAIFILLGILVILETFHVFRDRLLKDRAPKPEPAPAPAALEAGADRETLAEAQVLHFLGRLQEKGRLVDFVMDDIAPYSNEQVGAAARIVHQGCREALESGFSFEPVHGGPEGETVTLAEDFDARAFRLVGKVPERPPFTGTLRHRGWKASRVSLPRLTGDIRDASARRIVAPAEVEIG